jgi:hypothetical protein
MVAISDNDIATALEKVKGNFMSSCYTYVDDQFTLKNLCQSRTVQMVFPLILVVIVFLVYKPDWAIDKESGDYKYGKIIAASVAIYIVLFFAFAGSKAYFCPPCDK